MLLFKEAWKGKKIVEEVRRFVEKHTTTETKIGDLLREELEEKMRATLPTFWAQIHPLKQGEKVADVVYRDKRVIALLDALLGPFESVRLVDKEVPRVLKAGWELRIYTGALKGLEWPVAKFMLEHEVGHLRKRYPLKRGAIDHLLEEVSAEIYALESILKKAAFLEKKGKHELAEDLRSTIPKRFTVALKKGPRNSSDVAYFFVAPYLFIKGGKVRETNVLRAFRAVSTYYLLKAAGRGDVEYIQKFRYSRFGMLYPKRSYRLLLRIARFMRAARRVVT